ncbi:MAG TPA: hypothetical protein DCX95_05725 [Elusimicrobia bacterium]|nr:hypothetical protein [Elusimicrobiota bacterium]
MKNLLIVFLLFFTLYYSVYAASPIELILQVVEPPSSGKIPKAVKKGDIVNTVIEPEKGIYGLPWGSTIDETYKYFGKPNAIIQLEESKLVLIYGRTHKLIFRDGKLFCVEIRDQILDYSLADMLGEHPFFGDRWILSPGIMKDISKKEIVKKFDRENIEIHEEEDYRLFYDVGNVRVTIYFSSYSRVDEKGKIFKVHSISLLYSEK